MDGGTIRSGPPAMHPGELLSEDVMSALARLRAEVARLLGVSCQTDPACDPDGAVAGDAGMALRLGKHCGNGGAVA